MAWGLSQSLAVQKPSITRENGVISRGEMVMGYNIYIYVYMYVWYGMVWCGVVWYGMVWYVCNVCM